MRREHNVGRNAGLRGVDVEPFACVVTLRPRGIALIDRHSFDGVALRGEEVGEICANRALVVRDGFDVDEGARQFDCVDGH